MADLALYLMDQSKLDTSVWNCAEYSHTLVFAGWNNFLTHYFTGANLCQTKDWMKAIEFSACVSVPIKITFSPVILITAAIQYSASFIHLAERGQKFVALLFWIQENLRTSRHVPCLHIHNSQA